MTHAACDVYSGALGEYLGRLFLSVNRKPQYVVRRRHGFE